jgi:hypothetical protein
MWCPGTLELPSSRTVRLHWILRASAAERIIVFEAANGTSPKHDRVSLAVKGCHTRSPVTLWSDASSASLVDGSSGGKLP